MSKCRSQFRGQVGARNRVAKTTENRVSFLEKGHNVLRDLGDLEYNPLKKTMMKPLKVR